jgi:hypothetical protein
VYTAGVIIEFAVLSLIVATAITIGMGKRVLSVWTALLAWLILFGLYCLLIGFLSASPTDFNGNQTSVWSRLIGAEVIVAAIAQVALFIWMIKRETPKRLLALLTAAAALLIPFVINSWGQGLWMGFPGNLNFVIVLGFVWYRFITGRKERLAGAQSKRSGTDDHNRK